MSCGHSTRLSGVSDRRTLASNRRRRHQDTHRTLCPSFRPVAPASTFSRRMLSEEYYHFDGRNSSPRLDIPPCARSIPPACSSIHCPAYALVGRVGRLPVIGSPPPLVLVNGAFNRVKALRLLRIDGSAVQVSVDEQPDQHEQEDGKHDGSEDGERIHGASHPSCRFACVRAAVAGALLLAPATIGRRRATRPALKRSSRACPAIACGRAPRSSGESRVDQRSIDRTLPSRLLPSEARINDAPQWDDLRQRECSGETLRVEGCREHAPTKVQDDRRIRSSTPLVRDRLRSSTIAQLNWLEDVSGIRWFCNRGYRTYLRD